jgi:hypothetical protein
MARAQRTITLRTIRAYRTVSAYASMLLTSNPPTKLLALKKTRIRRRIEEAGPTIPANIIKKEEMKISNSAWQNRWDRSTKGRWTHRLFPNVDRWLNKPSVTEFLFHSGSDRTWVFSELSA